MERSMVWPLMIKVDWRFHLTVGLYADVGVVDGAAPPKQRTEKSVLVSE